MREQNAEFAMELSGHYYYVDLHYTDNALQTLVEVINILSSQNEPLSELVKPFQRYPNSGEINLKADNNERVLARLEAQYEDGHVDHLEGISVDYQDWWFNVRPSHTEPLLRLNLGAVSQSLLNQKSKELLSRIRRIDNAE
jgi:phosphomannomutase